MPKYNIVNKVPHITDLQVQKGNFKRGEALLEKGTTEIMRDTLLQAHPNL
jgi:hypothetical protein